MTLSTKAHLLKTTGWCYLPSHPLTPANALKRDLRDCAKSHCSSRKPVNANRHTGLREVDRACLLKITSTRHAPEAARHKSSQQPMPRRFTAGLHRALLAINHPPAPGQRTSPRNTRARARKGVVLWVPGKTFAAQYARARKVRGNERDRPKTFPESYHPVRW